MTAQVSGASMARGKSRQDYGTPVDFLEAVARRFGPLDVDLAATADNRVAPLYISPAEDSLTVPWSHKFRGNLWLNPPFADIAPWARKCAYEAADLSPHSRILLLVPASVGANWFAEHVHRKAFVLALQGRLTFVGEKDPYPRDLVLAVYSAGPPVAGFDTWSWRVKR